MPLLDLASTERLLAPRTIAGTEDLGGPWAKVVRLTLDDGSSVVVKERRREGVGWGYDRGYLQNEWAALAVLGELGAGVSPTFVAGDDDAGVLVMSDLGRHEPVEATLLDPERGAEAQAALVEHGRALGRLHAATASADVAARFTELRRRLDRSYDARAARRRYVSHDLLELWEETAGFAASLGFTPASPAAGADLDELQRHLDEPGPFLALTNLDASPQNVVLGADRAWIVDFEGAAMRHLSLDACMLRFPFPNYGHWAVLPEDVRAAMEAAYRRELVAGGVDVAGDDASFARAMAIGCAATVVLRIHRLPRIADEGEQALRRRSQMVSAIDVFRDAATAAGVFPDLAGWFAGLAAEMRARWEEANAAPRQFPALPLPQAAAR